MPENLVSGGLFFFFVTALWLLYLMPNWVRRREYLATERNALRLQQTLRVLAATSETPEEVTMAVNSRAVKNQEQLLHEHEKRERAALKARQSAQARALKSQIMNAQGAVNRQTYRIRRSRLMSTAILFVSIIAGIVGVAILGIASTAAIWLIVGAIFFGLAAVVILRQLAIVSVRLRQQRQEFIPSVATRRSSTKSTQVVQVEDMSHAEQQVAISGQQQRWTPQGVPSPSYIRNASSLPAAPVNDDAQEELLAAVERAKERLRQAQRHIPAVPQHAKGDLLDLETVREETVREAQKLQATGTDAGSVASASSAVSAENAEPIRVASRHNGFDTMGKIEMETIARPDFDAALARRRNK